MMDKTALVIELAKWIDTTSIAMMIVETWEDKEERLPTQDQCQLLWLETLFSLETLMEELIYTRGLT